MWPFIKKIQRPKAPKYDAQERELTVSVTNMADYVRVAEILPLDALSEFMNRYCELNVEEIHSREGCVDRFEGDKIFAFWGLFETEKHSAQLACEAAMAQIQAMKRFHVWAAERGYPCPGIRIGINTGQMVVGNMGSDQRMGYSVMGKEVSIAHAVEEAAKKHGFEILVSESTAGNAQGVPFGEPVSVDFAQESLVAYPVCTKSIH
ncbi:adenylate/guanylate cyclase domain-containing protein [Desulfatibacillum aliphaticivorans]|uniref:adenylate/guanylate cyclase domain-containing protein n=1 Tax=Desulfatibacillum aliphaticivorans TaxID=218208 RepID=UPI000426D6EF|nr:adenylate/guanylate cyclase domain-containing protein [Desulfatibacillum aliphaticivorans]